MHPSGCSPTETTPRQKNESLNDSFQPFSVAIIGASYGGLALANALQQYSIRNAKETEMQGGQQLRGRKQKFKVNAVILEATGPPSYPPSSFVVGDFYLPTGKFAMKELGLSSCINEKKLTSTESSNCLVISREFLITTLRENCKFEIRYRHKIVRIESSQNESSNHEKNLYCIAQCGTQIGPFNLIVAADGVRSAFRLSSSSSIDRVGGKIALIGDARWAQDRWWDLGMKRVQRGADVSICDALELGKLLLSLPSRDDGNRKVCDDVERRNYFRCLPNSIDLGKFCFLRKQRKLLLWRRIRMMLLLMGAVIYIYWART